MLNKDPRKITTFKALKEYLEKPGKAGKDVLEAFDCLADAAIIFSPAFWGPQCSLFLDALDAKDRLFKMANKVYDFITDFAQPDYITRANQLRTAYALVFVTSYIESLLEIIPDELVIKLKEEVPKIKEFILSSGDSTKIDYGSIKISDYYADHTITYDEVLKNTINRYAEASKYLNELIDVSIKTHDEQELLQIRITKRYISELPRKALKRYDEQYLDLALKFDDFAYFAQNDLLRRIDFANSRNKEALEKLINYADSVDYGLKNLCDLVNSITTSSIDKQVEDIVIDLRNAYSNLVKKPIIDDKEINTADEKTSIKFPIIEDAFIPQSYKCLNYINNNINLEDKSVWKPLPAQNDLGDFFIRYLYSLDSINCPLIILGHPGSGKSLLTKVLSAQLMSDSYTVVRIPLREVNADCGIDTLVKMQIQKEINRPLPMDSYGEFACHFSKKPLVIILDGYDELLQAKGKVFSGYLDEVQKFQDNQKALNRPVRIIITSRITLINKAIIPLNSTIIRLLEFDPEQQDNWISIWNETNKSFFAKEKIRKFKLPTITQGKNNSILELAKQPLLLLMLAIYDSDSNELAKDENINRTELYDKLIRRFILREQRRYVDFEYTNQEAEDKIVDVEMKRLGIVAMGMYNRREVVISSKQLEADLNIFCAHRNADVIESHTLKDSDSLLGSFFFVHQSIAKDVEAHSNTSESAYEFLHNTFGEFLAADFILRNITDTVVNAYRNMCSDIDPENFIKPDWYYCLMFVPLFTRPVVVEMLREHLVRAINNNLNRKKMAVKISTEEYLKTLRELLEKQLIMVLTKRRLPELMRADNLFDSNISLIGYLSTYSLNLIVLLCALNPDGYTLDENFFITDKKIQRDIRPWDELVSLWKSWFSQTDLIGLSVILKAERTSDTTIYIKCNHIFEAKQYKLPIDTLLCVSYALGDTFISGLSCVYTSRFNEITQLTERNTYSLLSNENQDAYCLYVANTLRKLCDDLREIEDVIVNYSRIKKINGIIENLIKGGDRIRFVNYTSFLSLFDVLELCLSNKLVYYSMRRKLIQFLNYHSESSKNLRLRLRYLEEQLLSTEQYISDPTFDKYLDEDLQSNSSRSSDSFSKHLSANLPSLVRYHYNDCIDINVFNDMEQRYVIRLINSIENKKNREQRLFLEDTLNDRTIDKLILINPELLLRLILLLFNLCEQKKLSINSSIYEIASYSMERLKGGKIICSPFDTVINAMAISKKIVYEPLLSELSDYVLQLLSSSTLAPILIANPNYISDLLEAAPKKTIMRVLLIMIEFFDKVTYSNEIICRMRSDLLLDYLFAFYDCYIVLCMNNKSTTPIIKSISFFVPYILKRVNLQVLSIEKISKLKTCAELVGNKELLTNIEETLRM